MGNTLVPTIQRINTYVCESLTVGCSLSPSNISCLCHCRMEADRKVYQLQKAHKRHGAPAVKAKAKKVC